MKKDLLSIATVLTCASLIIPGCIKSNEYLQRLDDIGKICKVRSIIYTPSGGPNGSDTVTFHYNIYGDPDSATYPPNSPFANLYFRYDTHHRLKDYIYGYSDRNSAIFWIRYHYANDYSRNAFVDSDYILPDQMFHFPPHTAGGAGPAWANYTYDSLGRITVADFNSGSETVFFNYDAHGDLIFSADQNFNGPDDKVNLNRTSKVFQFLSFDYSVNNRFIAKTYNHYGLPTDIDINGMGFTVLFSVIDYRTAHIEYDCSVP